MKSNIKMLSFLLFLLFVTISMAFAISCLNGGHMEKNPINHPPGSLYSRIFNQNPDIRKIEKKLRDYELIWRTDVQQLLRSAYYGSSSVKKSALHRLEAAIEAYQTRLLRNPDSFKPYGSYDLLSKGQIHLLTQMDGIPWKIPIDTPLTGMLVVGPQNMGKTRFIVRLCTEIKKADPTITTTLVDPKGTLVEFSDVLNFTPIDLSHCSFSINKVDGVEYSNMVLELMPPLGDTAGLIYGTEVLNESALIALDKLNKYEKATGQISELSFQDIYSFLPLVESTKSGRRSGYREAAQTSLRRMMGENNLFTCRKGVDLKWLFENNTILNARSLTDDMQCKALALLLIYTRFQQCRYLPPTSKLHHLIIIDDASRFIGNTSYQQNINITTSPLGHYLATLRSTGSGICCATQLPAHIDNSFIALSRSMVAIGSMAGAQHLKVIEDFMRLSPEQIKAVTRLSRREVIAFSPNTAYKDIFHGWVPNVPDPPLNTLIPPVPDLGIIPWQHLDDIPHQESKPAKFQKGSSNTAESPTENQIPELNQFKGNTQKLLWDVVTYLFSFTNTRIKRLGISVREFETAKQEAVNSGMLLESSAGKSLLLIPTMELFAKFNMIPPYSRNVSIEHSFYVLLFAHILKSEGFIKKVQTEFPINQSGSTGDILTITASGIMHVYEVTLNTSNLLVNAIKYKESCHSKIIFLCRDSRIADAAEKYLKNCDLDQKLAARLEITYFYQVFKNYRKIINL